MPDEHTKKEIAKVSETVLRLLKEDERCRNDDKWLTYRVMREFTNIYIPFADFEKIPAFETIKRVRAKIQNKDRLYQPTDSDVLKKRRTRAQTFNELFR